jgi:hypothetical protein
MGRSLRKQLKIRKTIRQPGRAERDLGPMGDKRRSNVLWVPALPSVGRDDGV